MNTVNSIKGKASINTWRIGSIDILTVTITLKMNRQGNYSISLKDLKLSNQLNKFKVFHYDRI